MVISDMSEGKLFVISGPSGVGKGTVIAKVMEDVPNIWKSVSATTRKPREGEVDGREYFFMTREEFERGIEEGKFLEWAEYAGNLYGTPKESVEDRLAKGENVILEIEVKGSLQVRDSKPDSVLVFIAPPSMEELESRLRGRGSESERDVELRLEAAKLELASEKEYNRIFVNDDLATVVRELEDYIAEQ